jgi:hypothetical protein
MHRRIAPSSRAMRDGRFRRRILRVAERLEDHSVGVAVHLPVVLGCCGRAHEQQWAFRRELQHADIRRRGGQHVRDLLDRRLQAVDRVDCVDAVRDLRGQVDATVRRRAVVGDVVREDLVVADDRHDVVGGDDRRAEQAEFLDRARDAACVDHVADLERAQHLHEHTCSEMREQAAPGGADREAETGEQGSERGCLHAEDLQDREDQQDRQQYADDGGQVVGQCRVDLAAAAHDLAEQARADADRPAADEPQHDRGEEVEAEVETAGHQELLGGGEIDHAFSEVKSRKGGACTGWRFYNLTSACAATCFCGV